MDDFPAPQTLHRLQSIMVEKIAGIKRTVEDRLAQGKVENNGLVPAGGPASESASVLAVPSPAKPRSAGTSPISSADSSRLLTIMSAGVPRLWRRSSASVAPESVAPSPNTTVPTKNRLHFWNVLPVELLGSLASSADILAAMDSYSRSHPIVDRAVFNKRRRSGFAGSSAGDLWAVNHLTHSNHLDLPAVQQQQKQQTQSNHLNVPTGQQQTQHRHYVFGYGSLVNPCSRIRTLPSATAALPCLVRGWARSWSYNCANRYTAVGLVPDAGSVVNGVLIPISGHDDLARLDLRETDYERTVVDPASVFLLLDGQSELVYDPSSVTIWTYKSRDPSHSPSAAIPLAQSYLDCILQGARTTLGEHFARLFLHLTQLTAPVDGEGWYVDDRLGAAAAGADATGRSGRTSPVSNGLLNMCPLQEGQPKRRYAGKEIERADTAWIDELLRATLGSDVLASRVVDLGYRF